MASVLAIENLMSKVAARFDQEGPQCVQLFGWHAALEQVEGDRIVWAPGDPGGKVGTTTGARMPGRHPRSIATLNERFTITISAADPSQPDNEAAQYRAAWLLRLYWFRAVFLAAHGTFEIAEEQWLIDRKERRYGATLRITLVLQAAIFDMPPLPVTEQVQAERAEVTLTMSQTGTPVTDVYTPEETQ